MTTTVATKVKVTDPVLLIRINQLYRPGMSTLALYEATRGIWRVGGARRDRVKYALAVFGGIIVEVYRVDAWSRARSSGYATRDLSKRNLVGRWEFTGTTAPRDVRARYRGRSVAHFFRYGNRNPVMYRNVVA
jgi:uncharacterized protein